MMNAPDQIAEFCVTVAKKKASTHPSKLFILGIFAGMFIALASVTGNSASGVFSDPGVAKLIGALVFPVGLAMVLIAGAELFTGNNLMVTGILSGEITFSAMLKNWFFVYSGNLAGSVFIAFMANLGNQMSLFDNAVAVTAMKAGIAKCSLAFPTALVLGILCNILVCTAVWMSFGAKSVPGKIIAIYFPVMAFVLCGTEHSIANMYYIPAAIFAKSNPAYVTAAQIAGLDLSALSWGGFLGNLIPVTLGNIIGGCLVATLYYFVYLKKDSVAQTMPKSAREPVSHL